MKTSKIVIKNLFGIRETTLDGKSVEISGPKGAGKTSVLDAIRFALTNRSERDCIVHQGADEGEIIIETTTGLSIDRKALPAKSAGTVKVRDGSLLQTRPAEFLSQIFTPLQLNPVEFTQLSRQEKNRVILSLIEFDWDVNWIREQFGEIPQGVDYSKHILEVLNDIQAENGVYFQSRQNINRDIRNKQAFISDIAKDIPSGYDYDRWNQYPIGERYRELERLREKNSVIERAKAFRANFTSKLRGLEGSRDVEIGAIDRDIAAERAALTGSIERMKAELQATEEKLAQLSRRRQDRVDIATANFEAAKAKLEKDVGVAEQYADQEPVDTTALAAEVTNAEEMRKHLNEYQRMVAMQAEVQDLTDQSAELTRKIELARELPATILAEAHIPVEGLTVENGIPLINGLPISNLSDGELLELCVDISVCKPGQLEIILIDGAERLDKESRERLYAKCKAMVTEADGMIHAKVWGILPKDRIEIKTKKENVDYRKLIAAGSCFAEGEEVIDYGFVERWILGLEEKYGVEVMQVGYDRYNAISTVQKLEANSMECVEVKQHSSVLHPPTKLLREAILKKEFAYDENRLLEINFQNARCTEDTNLNKYVNKKRSAGKVDMVVSTIIAVYLMQQAMLDNSELDWGIQVI